MSEPVIWIDGEWKTKQTAAVSVYDHGLLYGDGVFEGMRIYAGKVFRLDDHLTRLFESAHTLLLTIPYPRAEVESMVKDAVKRSGRATKSCATFGLTRRHDVSQIRGVSRE